MGKIHRLSVDIKLPSDTSQSGAMDIAGKYVKDYFIPAIESAVSDFDDMDSIVIPHIEINLGRLSLSDVPEKLEAELRDELSRALPSVVYSPESVQRSVDYTDSIQRSQTTHSHAVSSNRAVFELFLEYVSKGYTDFHSMEANFTPGEITTEAMMYVSKNPVDKIRLVDTIRSHYPFSFYRLESFVPQDTFPDFVAALLEDGTNVEALIREYESHNTDYSVKNGLSNLYLQFVLETKVLKFSRPEGILMGFPERHLWDLPLEAIRTEEETIRTEKKETIRTEEIEVHMDGLGRVVQKAQTKDALMNGSGHIESDYRKVSQEFFGGSEKGQEDSRVPGLSQASPYDTNSVNDKSPYDSTSEGIPGPVDRSQSISVDHVYSLIRNILSHKFYSVNYQDAGLHKFLEEYLWPKFKNMISKEELTEVRLLKILQELEDELGSLDLEVRLDKRIHTDDAGLVIFHPFYRMIFSRLGLIDEHDCFVSLDARVRAAHLLKCISDGPDSTHNDNDMLFCKLLCGIPLELPLESGFEISETEREEIESLYASVLNYWNPFKSDSAESLRMAFIKRGGTVEKDDSSFIVRVAGSAVDILMDDLPWEISMIYLPWTLPFFVEWQKEF